MWFKDVQSKIKHGGKWKDSNVVAIFMNKRSFETLLYRQTQIYCVPVFLREVLKCLLVQPAAWPNWYCTWLRNIFYMLKFHCGCGYVRWVGGNAAWMNLHQMVDGTVAGKALIFCGSIPFFIAKSCALIWNLLRVPRIAIPKRQLTIKIISSPDHIKYSWAPKVGAMGMSRSQPLSGSVGSHGVIGEGAA